MVSLLTFVLVAITPGDPAVRILGAGASPEQYAALDQKLGLTNPIYSQYLHWLSGLVHGNLGVSLFTSQPVTTLLNQRLEVTLSLVIGATLVSLVIGVALGTLAATLHGGLGSAVNTTSWLGFAIPNYWLGLVLILVLAVKVHWFPATDTFPSDRPLAVVPLTRYCRSSP